MTLNRKFLIIAAAAVLGVGVFAGCGPKDDTAGTTGDGTSNQGLAGEIKIDGSSTVYLISQAHAQEFMAANPKVKVDVSSSGTGGGMKKFVRSEIDVCGASRPIKQSEIDDAQKNGVEFVEVPVAFDGLSIVVNPQNTWVDHLTVEELKKIWEPGSKINNWNQVRAGFPDEPLKLYGAGTDSGTFEYFTEAIVGEAKASRPDYTPSEDDNILVQGVSGEKGALGYFGYGYYIENKDKLKLVPVKSEGDPVAPSPETINDGTYSPLSRPLFIYVTKKAMERPEVKAFVEYSLGAKGRELVGVVGYVALPEKAYEVISQRVQNMTPGSVFSGLKSTGMKIEDVLAREQAPKP